MAKDPRAFADQALSLTGETVFIVTGNEGSKFSIHENLIRQHSSFFDVALKKEWMEGKERLVELPEDDSETFGLYANWLYKKRIHVRARDKNDANYSLLSKAYVLGEKLLDNKFKDAVLDTFVASCSTPDAKGVCWYPTNSIVDRIYKGTPLNSQARRLMVDMHVYKGSEAWVDPEELDNVEFLVDLSRKLLSLRPSPSSKYRTQLQKIVACIIIMVIAMSAMIKSFDLLENSLRLVEQILQLQIGKCLLDKCLVKSLIKKDLVGLNLSRCSILDSIE